MGWRNTTASVFQVFEQMMHPGCVTSTEPMNEQFAAVGKLSRQRRCPMESIPGARREQTLASIPTRGAVKPLVDE